METCSELFLKYIDSVVGLCEWFVLYCLLSRLVSGLAACSAELGGCDRERPGPTVSFPWNVPFQGRTWVGNIFTSVCVLTSWCIYIHIHIHTHLSTYCCYISFVFLWRSNFMFVTSFQTWSFKLVVLVGPVVFRQRGLFRVLKAYTHYKPEEGYCQAQGPVAAVLLMNMPAEVAINMNLYTFHWRCCKHF